MNLPALKWLAILCTLLLVPAAALPQSRMDPGALPKSTLFYLAWHGTPQGEARKANSLFALWDDPGFAPVRDAMVEEMLSDSAAKKTQAPLTREELTQYASLLDNEVLIGYIGNPERSKYTVSASGSKPKPWNGLFLVYDRTGKEADLAKLMLRMRASENDPPVITTTTVGGIAAIKIERKSGTSYWAEDGPFAYTASEPSVFQQIAAFTKKRTGANEGLGQSAGYREASDLLKGGVLEFFVHLAGIRDSSWDTSAGGFRLQPVLQSLKLETVHAIAGHMTLEVPRTRVQGAVLGEASPGTLFDIWDEGSTAPVSLQFVNDNTVVYQESRVNLNGIYGLVKRALQAAGGSGQQTPADFIEKAAQTRLGMPLPTAFGLFSGEFASLQTNRAFDSRGQVYIFGIQQKPEVLKLLRAALAERLSNERTEGGTTFFRVSEGGIANDTGTASWKYFHVAVTNDLIVGAARSETVREALALRKTSSDGAGKLPQSWQAAREQFPAKLNGMNFVNFEKVDWAAAKLRWNAELASAASGSGTGPRTGAANRKTHSETNSGPVSKALSNLDPQIFQRHLHLSAGASWKDAKGVHFDGWLE